MTLFQEMLYNKSISNYFLSKLQTLNNDLEFNESINFYFYNVLYLYSVQNFQIYDYVIDTLKESLGQDVVP